MQASSNPADILLELPDESVTFGPHGDDDVGGKGLALDDGPRAPQRDLDGHQVVTDVGVRL